MTLADFLNELSLQGLESFRKYYSAYEGIVQSNEDPEKLGRLKVVVHSITGNEVTGWIPAKGLPAGATSGILNLPKKGDAVWISCQNGDPMYMLWEYGWGFKGGINDAFKNYGQGVALYNKDYRLDITDSNIEITKGQTKIELKAGSIEINDGSHKIKVEDGIEINDGVNKIEVKGGKIFLGGLLLEPAVMGDKLGILLNAILDLLAASTVSIPGIPLPIPLSTQAGFTALKPAVELTKSQTVKVGA